MIILGLDPGLATTGYGIVEVKDRELVHRDHGILKTSPSALHHERLVDLSNQLNGVIRGGKPDYVGIEKLFINKNVKTAMMVGEARGVLVLTVAKRRMPLYEFTPLQVKQALTGYGKATKQQVQKMVQRLLQMREMPKPDDAADALAVAICLSRTLKSY